MTNLFYTVLFIATFIMMIIMVSHFKNRVSVYHTLMFVSIMLTNYGYMQLTSAKNIEMAIVANQTIYLGASFCPFFLLMCLADLCKIEIKKIFQFLFVLFGCVLFTFTSTIGMLPWYYKSVTLIQENGMSHLVKEYGPLHAMYPIYLILVVVLSFVFIIYSYRTKKDVSYITSIWLTIVVVFMVTVYMIEKTLKLNIEILPLAYVVSLAVVLFLLRRISMYDVAAITSDSMEQSDSYGFVLYDSNGKYLGCDTAAKRWFPELEELPIDIAIDFSKTSFLEELGKWNKGEALGEKKYFQCGEVFVSADHTILREQKKRIIHCVYLSDDTKQQQYTKLVESYNENLERDVNAKTEKIFKIQNDIIISMASIVENRDNNTGGHIQRTSDVVRIFAKYLVCTDEFKWMEGKYAKAIIKAAPLHDFGKIAIPDVILNKPGRFTDEEYEKMKAHSAKGAVIVERILQNSEDTEFKKIAVNVAHYHHEKWDGNGYPDHLKGEEIPFEARVMALADVFDALVSKRVYKDSYSYDKAFQIIEESCGTHFDPDLCKAFLKCRKDFEKLYDSYEE